MKKDDLAGRWERSRNFQIGHDIFTVSNFISWFSLTPRSPFPFSHLQCVEDSSKIILRPLVSHESFSPWSYEVVFSRFFSSYFQFYQKAPVSLNPNDKYFIVPHPTLFESELSCWLPVVPIVISKISINFYPFFPVQLARHRDWETSCWRLKWRGPVISLLELVTEQRMPPDWLGERKVKWSLKISRMQVNSGKTGSQGLRYLLKLGGLNTVGTRRWRLKPPSAEGAVSIAISVKEDFDQISSGKTSNVDRAQREWIYWMPLEDIMDTCIIFLIVIWIGFSSLFWLSWLAFLIFSEIISLSILQVNLEAFSVLSLVPARKL